MSANAEIARLFALQETSHRAARSSSAEVRKAKLARMKDVVLAHAEEICNAIHADLGRPVAMAMSAEVRATVAEIDEAIAHLAEWMASAAVTPSLPIPNAVAEIRPEARGRVLVLGPWNFPVGLVLQPIVAAIAAGNTVIAKPNELSPQSSAITTLVLREAFDETDVAVVEGDVAVAQALLDLPFDHIFFTGSPAVGRSVMAAAAQHLASVTLELGGKCPVIIDRGTDLVRIAQQVIGGRCINAGQLCLAPDHVWIHRDQGEAFLGALTTSIKAMFYTEDGHFNPGALGTIVNERNFTRVAHYIEDALNRGARVHCGGELHKEKLAIEPTVLVDVPLDAKVMVEEIFGPILPVQMFDDVEEVFAYHRTRGKPLAVYAFSPESAFIESVLANIPSGGATVNGLLLHASDLRLPFGGVNESGMGRYHGIHGFRELSHERAVFRA